MTDELTKEEFCTRFVAHMVAEAKRMFGRATFDDGSSIEEYAIQAAPTYWDERDFHLDTPEECADADISYWGDFQ